MERFQDVAIILKHLEEKEKVTGFSIRESRSRMHLDNTVIIEVDIEGKESIEIETVRDVLSDRCGQLGSMLVD